LKENLKPKIQRVVRQRYGVRGRATGAGGLEVTSAGEAVRDDVKLDVLLQDMYVFLLKECNVVLNGLFASTVIARDVAEVEAGGRVDDEEEEPAQAFARLGELAADAEADGRFAAAEQRHLERVQLAASDPAVAQDVDKVYAAYALLAEFLLRRSAKLIALGGTVEESEGLLQLAREVRLLIYVIESYWC
jgi:hypothetical protein